MRCAAANTASELIRPRRRSTRAKAAARTGTPMANATALTLTSCPAAASVTLVSAAIWGSRPTTMNSVLPTANAPTNNASFHHFTAQLLVNVQSPAGTFDVETYEFGILDLVTPSRRTGPNPRLY